MSTELVRTATACWTRLLERSFAVGRRSAARCWPALTDPGDYRRRSPARLLAALRAKGVTAEELRGLRARHAGGGTEAGRSPAPPRAVDIVGTGGDKSGSYNLSTGAALLAAAAGLNPSSSTAIARSPARAGSADVLEALGLTLPLDEARNPASLLRAHRLHLPVRAALPPGHEGRRPGACGDGRAHRLQHPRAAEQSGGAGLPRDRRVRPAHRKAAWPTRSPACRSTAPSSIHGSAWLGRAHAARSIRAVRRAPRQRAPESSRTPANFGLQTCQERDLLGGDAAFNAAALTRVLRGEDDGRTSRCAAARRRARPRSHRFRDRRRAPRSRAPRARSRTAAPAALLGQLAAFGGAAA